VTARTPVEVLDLAAGLKRENPERTAAQVTRILRTHLGWAPSESTVLRLFTRLELSGPAGKPGKVFGRFEAAHPNDRWTGDALHGIQVAGRKTYLFAFLDDHSRMVVGHRWGLAEDTVRLASALRPALASRGVPSSVYVDNGSAFVDSWLLRACAVLGVKLIHSTPGRPEGRGKIERFFETVRAQFLVEVTGTNQDGRHQVNTLDELNRRCSLGRDGLPPNEPLRPDRPLDRWSTFPLRISPPAEGFRSHGIARSGPRRVPA
jgi:putative transposase